MGETKLSLALACWSRSLIRHAVGRSSTDRAGHCQPRNPLIRDLFTADPAPLVVGDTLYLYTGPRPGPGDAMFDMRDWLLFSTRDMKNWTPHAPIMRQGLEVGQAGSVGVAGHREERQLYFYAAVAQTTVIRAWPSASPLRQSDRSIHDASIGPDHRPDDTRRHARWEDIDPTVFTDDDGTTWIALGNRDCYIAKLKPNMTEITARSTRSPRRISTKVPGCTNAAISITSPMHRSIGNPERRTHSYATATSLDGPWTIAAN